MAESVLYSFAGGTDGANPEYGQLVDVQRTLYGTTYDGGASNRGTVFKITTSGAYTQLHDLTGGAGDHPQGGLAKVRGNLYGTTLTGGGNSYNFGTVFKVTISGNYGVLYSFVGGSDGNSPKAGLTDVAGTLYGTTSGGGASGNGTVFKITTSGMESVLYSFAGGADGAQPIASLIDVNGTLYGTTFKGGTNNAGTVFQITTSGAESVLYSFAGDTSIANLTNVDGTLYGTTSNGGAIDSGTVFKITTSGAYTQLHSFAGGTDGANPSAALLLVGQSALYGTTQSGGTGSCNGGCGTVFRITTSGNYRVLYSFAGGSDGASPYGGLTKVNRTLYGTTFQGGASDDGTVFSLTGY